MFPLQNWFYPKIRSKLITPTNHPDIDIGPVYLKSVCITSTVLVGGFVSWSKHALSLQEICLYSSLAMSGLIQFDFFLMYSFVISTRGFHLLFLTIELTYVVGCSYYFLISCSW